MPFQTASGPVVLQMANKDQEGRDEGKNKTSVLINFSVQDEELLITLGQEIRLSAATTSRRKPTPPRRSRTSTPSSHWWPADQLQPVAVCEEMGRLAADLT